MCSGHADSLARANAEEIMPADVVGRLRKLFDALQRNGKSSASWKVTPKALLCACGKLHSCSPQRAGVPQLLSALGRCTAR